MATRSQSSSGPPANDDRDPDAQRQKLFDDIIKLAKDADEHDAKLAKDADEHKALIGREFGAGVLELQGHYGTGEIERLVQEMKAQRARWASKTMANTWAQVALAFTKKEVNDLLQLGFESSHIQQLARITEKHRRDNIIQGAPEKIPTVKQLKAVAAGKPLPEHEDAVAVVGKRRGTDWSAKLDDLEKGLRGDIRCLHELQKIAPPEADRAAENKSRFNELNKLLEDIGDELNKLTGEGRVGVEAGSAIDKEEEEV